MPSFSSAICSAVSSAVSCLWFLVPVEEGVLEGVQHLSRCGDGFDDRIQEAGARPAAAPGPYCWLPCLLCSATGAVTASTECASQHG
jgi:hypothetical protein